MSTPWLDDYPTPTRTPSQEDTMRHRIAGANLPDPAPVTETPDFSHRTRSNLQPGWFMDADFTPSGQRWAS